MNPYYPQVAQRANHRCEYCRAPEAIFNFPFEVEHIIPASDSGSDDLANFALACRSCNGHKSDFTHAVDPETGEAILLFHPRNDIWEEHFIFDLHSLEIQGRTAKGRATVIRLQMNRASQLTGRSFWVRLGVFP